MQGVSPTEAEKNKPESQIAKTGSRSVNVNKQAAAAPEHVVIVMEENHSQKKIIGNSSAPYMNSLAKQGAYFTQSYGTDHPSQPNYLVLFSGSNHGIHSDSCGHTLNTPNLASELIKHKYTFAGYSEDLPSIGSKVCTHKQYGRKHSPWVNFTNVPESAHMRFSDFPTDYRKLPTVSFVIPNLDHDMHDGTIQSADNWLKNNLGPYVEWAKSHHSLLILTWDEDDYGSRNHIPTIMVGENIRPGNYDQKITHLNVLRMLEDMYHLPYVGATSKAEPINNIWTNNK
ncbi:acid phosphatase [Paenibacillus donghaensis]|uniref:alkaline phosphatase family protein n=1 Tax=Paenibacillus donghaensis TaxID=414771 RepID=UPI0018843D7C|nr:alkaline phosphatase family protein [Paenibacillus donghaensis]MBE9915164.1 acid phosphatase [Paenibacillus donghaensis]